MEPVIRRAAPSRKSDQSVGPNSLVVFTVRSPDLSCFVACIQENHILNPLGHVLATDILDQDRW